MKKWLVVFICVVWVQWSAANTIRVERDGSGDFTVIQHAVNAAVSGDTILIGPGRFDEREIVTTPGWSVPVYILIEQEELTLIGSGSDQTIVGQEEAWDFSQPRSRGIEAGPDWGSLNVHIEGIGFEHIAYAVGGNPAPNFEIVSCMFSNTYYGLITVGPANISVEQTEFSYAFHNGKMLYSSGNSELLVNNCSFLLDPEYVFNQVAVHIQGTVTSSFVTSQFIGGAHGLRTPGAGSIVVDGCFFDQQDVEGIGAASVNLAITNCLFSNQGYAISLQGVYSSVEIHDTEIFEVSLGSIRFEGFTNLIVNNCVLDNGPEYTIDQYSFCEKGGNDLPHADLRYNDWGTSEADSIESWIHVCDYIIDYVPFVGGPVPTRKSTLGGLKALYRDATR